MFLVDEKDQILKTKSVDFDFSNPIPNLPEIVGKMKDIMKNNKGIGLSPQQVGIDARFFIMGNDEYDFVCINPKIVSRSKEVVMDLEGCLSFPNLWLTISRPDYIDVEYFDLDGNLNSRRLHKVVARCFEHELDHLDGICFITKVSKLKLDMAMRKRLKK